MTDNQKPHYAGHRDRLRQKLLDAGVNALHDYELLEVILFAAIPRRDVKPLAKNLLNEFGSLWSLLNASPTQLKKAGVTDNVAALLLAVGGAGVRGARAEVIGKPILSHWERVVDYCKTVMAHEKKEQFRVLFLDRRNKLLSDDVMQKGTIDHTPVYPREIVQRALDIGAGAIILVHNHPTGDLTPSKADIKTTNDIVAACKPLEITVHDHIIVGRNDVASFKALGFL